MRRMYRKTSIKGRRFFRVMVVVYFLSFLPFAYIVLQSSSDLMGFVVYFLMAPVLLLLFSSVFLISALILAAVTGELETLFSRTRRTIKKYILVCWSAALLLSVLFCSILMMESYRQLIGDGVP